jgi:hypothetical protein
MLELSDLAKVATSSLSLMTLASALSRAFLIVESVINKDARILLE